MKSYAELRSDPRAKLADRAPLFKPFTIYVEPTNVCNFECSFCPQGLGDYKERSGYDQHMPLYLFRKVIDEIISFGGVTSLKLYFFGEPLLHPQFGEMVRIAGQASSRVEVTTNGTPLNTEKAQNMIDGGVHYLRVSIYEEYRKYWPLILRNVARLRKMRDDQGKTKPYIFAKCFHAADVPALAEIYAGIADEVGAESLHSIGSDCIPVERLTGTQKACAYPFYTLVVKANGDVVPCCVAWETSLVVGNVKNDTLLDIWRGEKLARIHRLHLEGNRKSLSACANCDTIFNSPDSVDALTVEEYNRRRQ